MPRALLRSHLDRDHDPSLNRPARSYLMAPIVSTSGKKWVHHVCDVHLSDSDLRGIGILGSPKPSNRSGHTSSGRGMQANWMGMGCADAATFLMLTVDFRTSSDSMLALACCRWITERVRQAMRPTNTRGCFARGLILAVSGDANTAQKPLCCPPEVVVIPPGTERHRRRWILVDLWMTKDTLCCTVFLAPLSQKDW